MATTLDTYMPYDAGPGSNVSEDGWRQFAKHWRGDGVIRSQGSEFTVFADSTGMQVKIPTGECWIQGNWGKTTTQKTLAIAAAHATLGRRDLVILRNDFVNNRIEFDIKTGTAASTPTYAPLVQNSAMWEIQLGKVVVGPAVVTIAAANVTALQQYTDGSCSYTVDSGFQAVPNSTITLVDWDLPQFDTSSVDRNGLNKFILQRTGMWMFATNLIWASNATGYRFVWVERTSEGPSYLANRLGINSVKSNAGGWNTPQTAIAMDRFTAGEEVAVLCYQDSGGNVNLENLWNGTRVVMFWLGP